MQQTLLNENIDRSHEPSQSPERPVPDTSYCVARLGVVIIGRNEGERLHRCLRSLVAQANSLVYVDSGSTDDSVSLARSLGVEVVELDTSHPFTAARARNAGLERLLDSRPNLEYVQFMDGDCEMVEGWLEQGLRVLSSQPEVVAVFGRIRERYRDRSVYNRLCDLEWDRPLGQVDECGGIALMRVEALRAVGGFNPVMIAGEEPELCFRMRQSGGRILRIEPDMAFHDAAMVSFRQWWRRSVRAGHAYAESMALHGLAAEHYCVRRTCSVLFWAAVLPFVALGAAYATSGLSLLALAAYVVLGLRIHRHHRRRGRSPKDCRLIAFSRLFGKFPQAWGVARYWSNRLWNRPTPLIEHK